MGFDNLSRGWLVAVDCGNYVTGWAEKYTGIKKPDLPGLFILFATGMNAQLQVASNLGTERIRSPAWALRGAELRFFHLAATTQPVVRLSRCNNRATMGSLN